MKIGQMGQTGPTGWMGRIGLAGGLAVFLFGIFSSVSAQAAPISLRVSPLSYDFVVNPGGEQGGKIVVENISNQGLKVTVGFSDFFIDENGNYFFSSEEEKSAVEKYKLFFMKDWFRADKKELFLKEGQDEIVNFSIQVPPDANLGGHYGAVFFRSSCRLENDQAVVATDKSRICVSARPGVLFLVQVGGEAVKSAKLKKAEIPKISFADRENLNVELENTGNTHFKPEGTVSAKSLFGKEIFRLDIKDKTILPGVSRGFSGVLERKDFLGIYKIAGAVKDGDGKEVKFEKWTFLVPWKEILVILGLVGIWIWLLRRFRVLRK